MSSSTDRIPLREIFLCEKCGMKFTDSSDFDHHNCRSMEPLSSSIDYTPHRTIFLCENCGVDYDDWCERKPHGDDTKHIVNEADPRFIYCEKCEEWYSTWVVWSLHIRTCEENYPAGNYPFQYLTCHRCYETDEELQDHFNDPAYVDWCREAETDEAKD